MTLSETKVSSYAVIQDGGMNDIFSEIINHEFVQPPYDKWFTNKWQYLWKRDGWTAQFTMDNEILDYYKYGEVYYVLEKIDTTTCKLWKVNKDSNGVYTVKTNLTPVAWIKYTTTYNKWWISIESPDVSSVKISNGTPTNDTSTLNANGDYSDILKDNTRSFDSSYIGTFWVITSHTEANVKDITIATPPVSPSTGDRYIVASWATGAWSGKVGQIAQWSWSAWVFTVPATGYFVWSTTQAKYYRCAVSTWPTYTRTNVSVSNWYKEWTRFNVIDIQDGITLRIDSSIAINNYDSYSIYTTLANYITFKYSGSDSDGKIWVNPLNDATTYFTSFKSVRDMVYFDSYLFGCTKNRVFYRPKTSSTSGLATNLWYNDDELTCIDSTGDFLLVWAKSKVYGIVRTTSSTAGTFSYASRELTQIGLFSKKSILTYGGSVYVCLSDFRRYGMNVSFTAQSAQVQLKDVWVKVQQYLNNITVWDEVEWFRYNSNFWFVVSWTYNWFVRYNEPRSGFLIDNYGYWFNNLQLDWDVTTSTYWTKLFLKWWDYDDDLEISTKIVIIWPEWVVWFPHRELAARITFWYNNDIVKFKVDVEMDWALYKNKISFDPERTAIVQWLNAFWDGTLWTKLLGVWMLWVWGNDDANNIGVVRLSLGKTCHIAKWTITNSDNSNFLFGRIDLLHQEANPLLVPIKNNI